MKRIFSLLLFWLVVQTSFAVAPVVMSGPTPAITNTYSSGSTTAITYTITNRVPGLSMPISVNGISGPVSRTAVANDCGVALPRGPSSCNIGVSIAPTGNNAGQTFQQTLSVDYQGRTPLTQPINFSVPSTLTGRAVFTVVGGDSNAGLLAVSNDGQGQAWNIVNTPSALPGSYFSATACTGTGATANCVIFGADGAGPIAFYSTDGAANWAQGDTSSLPASTNTQGIACSGTGTNMRCLNVGTRTGGPAAAYSIDQGQTWVVPAGVPNFGALYSASCTDTGSSAVCMGTGINIGNFDANVFVTINGGTSWNEYVVTGGATGEAVSCTGTGANVICVVSGSYIASQPFVAISLNKGTNWTLATIPGAPNSGNYNSNSCSGSGATARCVAAGVDYTTNPSPTAMIAGSIDGGATWQQANITGLAIGTDTLFTTANCSGIGADTVCIAAGYDNTSTTPLLAVAPNGGTTWSIVNNFGGAPLPFQGSFSSVSCTGSGATAICIAAGTDTTNSLGFIVESVDGGNTWSQATIGGLTPNSNFFNSSGTSSPLYFALSKYKV